MLHRHQNFEHKVAITSMSIEGNKRYLGYSATASIPDKWTAFWPSAKPTTWLEFPFYWDIIDRDGKRRSARFLSVSLSISPLSFISLVLPSDTKGTEQGLALSLRPDGGCEIGPHQETSSSWTSLLFLDITEPIQTALKAGAIGPYAYPHQSAYMTIGRSNEIRVVNHLTVPIYGAVEKPVFWQYKIYPGEDETWKRYEGGPLEVFINLTGFPENTNASVFEVPVGRVLHVQALNAMSEEEWKGECHHKGPFYILTQRFGLDCKELNLLSQLMPNTNPSRGSRIKRLLVNSLASRTTYPWLSQ